MIPIYKKEKANDFKGFSSENVKLAIFFLGKDSIMAKDKSTFGAGKGQPLVDKMKAVYLYQLGPNSTTINTDYQEYFSNQTSKYSFPCNQHTRGHYYITFLQRNTNN